MGIVVASLIPTSKVVMIDSKLESILRARQRIRDLGLKNTILMQANLEYYCGDFQVGTSLHSCGVATDLILNACLRKGASFVVSPCCYSSIHHVSSASDEEGMPVPNFIHSQILYPRSQVFRKHFGEEEFFAMGSVAERTEWDFQSDKAVLAKRFMGLIDTGPPPVYFYFFFLRESAS